MKVINPSKKSEAKLFILRNVDVLSLSDTEKVRKLLTDHFREEVSKEQYFDFGYYHGNKRVWVKNKEDLLAIKELLVSNEKQCNVTLWCMGRIEPQPAKRLINMLSDDSESDLQIEGKPKRKKMKKKTRQEERTERIDSKVDKLKQKH